MSVAEQQSGQVSRRGAFARASASAAILVGIDRWLPRQHYVRFGAGSARRALMLQSLTQRGLAHQRLDSSDLPEGSGVQVIAILASAERKDKALEQIVGRLSLEHSVTAVSWQAD